MTGNFPSCERSRIVMTLGGGEIPGGSRRGGCAGRLSGGLAFGNCVRAGCSDSAPAAVCGGCLHLPGSLCHPLGLCNQDMASSEAAGEEPEFSSFMLLCHSDNHRAALGRRPHWPPLDNLYTCFLHQFVSPRRFHYAFGSSWAHPSSCKSY